jgi:hypothetical protein
MSDFINVCAGFHSAERALIDETAGLKALAASFDNSLDHSPVVNMRSLGTQ